jgi:hypothetical protein
MPATDAVINSLTHEEFDRESSEYVLDLEAVFNLMQEDVLDLTKQAEEKGWAVKKLENEIKKLVGE